MIQAETDNDKKSELLNKYVDFVEQQLESIPFPYYIIHDIMWNMLSEYDKKSFRRFGFTSKNKMIKSIRVDEYQPILDFIGSKVLHLSGYNKKKV